MAGYEEGLSYRTPLRVFANEYVPAQYDPQSLHPCFPYKVAPVYSAVKLIGVRNIPCIFVDLTESVVTLVRNEIGGLYADAANILRFAAAITPRFGEERILAVECYGEAAERLDKLANNQSPSPCFFTQLDLAKHFSRARTGHGENPLRPEDLKPEDQIDAKFNSATYNYREQRLPAVRYEFNPWAAGIEYPRCNGQVTREADSLRINLNCSTNAKGFYADNVAGFAMSIIPIERNTTEIRRILEAGLLLADLSAWKKHKYADAPHERDHDIRPALERLTPTQVSDDEWDETTREGRFVKKAKHLLRMSGGKEGISRKLLGVGALVLMRDDEERARAYHRTRVCSCDLYLIDPPPEEGGVDME